MMRPQTTLQDLGGVLPAPETLAGAACPHPLAFPLSADHLHQEHLGPPLCPTPHCWGHRHLNAYNSQVHIAAGTSPWSSRLTSQYPEVSALTLRSLPGHANYIRNLTRPSYLLLPFSGDYYPQNHGQAISKSSLHFS